MMPLVRARPSDGKMDCQRRSNIETPYKNKLICPI
jgi:hypothetical protein